MILSADPQMMKRFSTDATFAEKRALFEALAAMPDEYRGMSSISKVVDDVIDWGPQGPQAQFGQDLQRVIAHVAQTNQALEQFANKYSALFLAVRTVAKLSSAAGDASKGPPGAVPPPPQPQPQPPPRRRPLASSLRAAPLPPAPAPRGLCACASGRADAAPPRAPGRTT